MKKPKILIVDDDPSLLSLYEAALSARGLKPILAKNAEEGLSMIESESPDLIVTDIMMPQVHGLHLLDIIKSTPETKDLKVMVLTALDDENTRNQAMGNGAIAYVVKSRTTMAEVIDQMMEVLG